MRAVMPSLLSDFPRGDPDRPADQFTPPDAAFAPPGGIKSTPALAWRAGMIFLGVVDGEVKTDADGRRYVVGGQAKAQHRAGRMARLSGDAAAQVGG
jgi:hypothetical protein